MGGLAKQFEDLRVWQDARILTNRVYDRMDGCKDFAFRDQIQRAAVSIMNNIAEGFERNTPADFARFLRIAKGSCGEVRSTLYLAEDRRYVAPANAADLRASARALSMGIAAFIRTIRK